MMLKKALFICTFVFITLPIFADQNIEIVGGSLAGLPKIAIVNFQGDSSDQDTNVTSIIANDLAITGEFNVSTYVNKAAVESSVAYTITGDVIGNAVNFSLYQQNGKKNLLVLHQKVALTSNSQRLIAHTVSNTIYKKITGTLGVFTSKIAYIIRDGGTYKLIVSDYDGYNQNTIVASHSPLISLTWDATNKKIAYSSLESGKPVVYVQDIYAGNRQKVANFSGTNSSPAFIPGKNELAVTLTKDYGSHIYLINDHAYNNQSIAKQLVHFGTIDTEASFTKNGNFVFTSNHDGGPQIFMTNLNNSASPTRLTFNLGNYNTTARFSHDGSKIVFIHRNFGTLKTYLLDLATNKAYPVSLKTNLDMSPSFAPNDKLILISSDNGMYIANSMGTIETRLNKINADEIIDQRWTN